MNTDTNYPANYFARRDDSDDADFYQFPRKVVHIDDQAIQALSTLLAAQLPMNGRLLDLMSSWRSHLPQSIEPAHVTGLGMNQAEMEDNPQLDEIVVQNLNQTPQLPFEDATFDAAICTVSVQYLTQPTAVFAEVNRVLRPGGPFIVSFSNRCFPTKAVAVWLGTNDEQHVQLVGDYFQAAGGWEPARLFSHKPRFADPLYAVFAIKSPSGQVSI